MDEHDLPIYRDAARYDAEHWWKTDDLKFWRRMTERWGPAVLELASGTGRIALEILAAPATYTGIEISPDFHRQAGEKLAPFGDRAALVCGDIRQVRLDRAFDLVIIGFNSFLHLLTDEDVHAALDCVRHHCHADTRFIIDLFVPDPLVLLRPAGHRIEAMSYHDPDIADLVIIEEANDFDPVTGRNHVTWYYSSQENPDFLVYDFTVRMIYPDTLDRLLHESGFNIEAKWGDYEETPLGVNSPLQI
ncbi:class I SAM-dependent methyltransferase, partial [Candidatus Neomarinimicrobiota bacterium]